MVCCNVVVAISLFTLNDACTFAGIDTRRTCSVTCEMLPLCCTYFNGKYGCAHCEEEGIVQGLDTSHTGHVRSRKHSETSRRYCTEHQAVKYIG